MQQEIHAYFQRRQQEMISDLARLISIRSVRGPQTEQCPYGEGPWEALLEAEAIARELHLPAQIIDGQMLAVDIGPQPAELGILAHLDVVPEGGGWTVEPYRITLTEDRIYGRGSADDKGPCIASLYALAAARELAPKGLHKGVRLLLGTAEETGCPDMAAYRAAHTLPPYCFSPDAGYPVINTEMGSHHPHFTQAWEKADDTPRICSLNGGTSENTVPREAQACIVGLDAGIVMNAAAKIQRETGVSFSYEMKGDMLCLNALGEGAHASSPASGKNALTAMLRLLCTLPLADIPSSRAIKQLNRLFPYGDNNGAAIGVAQADDVCGPLTLAFTRLDLTETGLWGCYDSRLPLCAIWENMGATAVAALRECGFSVTQETLTPAHHTPPEQPFVQTLLRVYERYTGERGYCRSMGGKTYVHGIPNGVAFGCGFVGVNHHMHGADEFILLRELMLSAEIFTQVILDMCG